MATRAERGKCVLVKDNLNVKSLLVFVDRGMVDKNLIEGIIDQVAYDHWQLGHDAACSDPECTHVNPYNEES